VPGRDSTRHGRKTGTTISDDRTTEARDSKVPGPTQDGPAQVAGPHHRILTREFALLFATAMALYLGFGVTVPILPRVLTDAFGVTPAVVGLVVGSMALSAIAVRPWIGKWGERFGRKRLVVVGLVLSALSYIGYALAPTALLVVPARLVTGVGQAIFFVGAISLLADTAPDHRRGEAVSYFSLAPWLGIGLGPILGETLYDSASGRVAFLVAGGIGMLGLLTAVLLPDPRPVVDPDHRAPRIHRAALGPGSVLGLALIGLAGFTTFVALYASEIGMAGSQAVFLLYAGTVLVVRVLGGKLPDRFGASRMGSIATLCGAIGLAVMALVPTPHGLYAGTIIFAVGAATQYPALFALTLSRVPEDERTSAISTFTMFFDLSAAVGAALLGPFAQLGGYRMAFAVGAGLCVVALLVLQLVVLTPEDRRSHEHFTLLPPDSDGEAAWE
jgi:MFS family permease